jgi:cysteine-rich repeat protein
MVWSLVAASAPACRPAVESGDAACVDFLDNDDDGRVDCADEGCVFAAACSSCGDDVLNDGEVCDDGNDADGDGCSSRCALEACGNGSLDDGEVCDDGNVVGGDGCSAGCQPDRCGDAVLQPDEGCEDGNRLDGDGCSRLCEAEVGDCDRRTDVECFDANGRSGDGCSAHCRVEFCGDGIVQPTLWERCDDTAPGAAAVGCTGCQIFLR